MPSTIKRWPYLTAVIIAACLGLQCLDYRANEQRVLADELPVLVTSESKLDFGEILPADTPEKTVTITNQSAREVAIKSTASTCSCTKVESDVTVLAPGESTDITVRLLVADYPSNKVNTRVLIATDGAEPQGVAVEVHAKITPEYLLTPDRLDFGEFKLASQPVRTITLKQNGDTPVKVLQVDAPDNVVVTFKPVPVKPDTGAPHEPEPHPTEWVIQVQPVAELVPGPLNGRVTVVTDVKRMPNIDVPINGRVLGIDCTITPKVIVFGPSKPGDMVATVLVDGSNDLRIASVTCEDSELEFTKPSQSGTGAHTFDILLRADAAPGDKGGKIAIELTEGPARQTVTVPYFGTVVNAS
jgi:hypothetical protein